MVTASSDLCKVLLSEEALAARVSELAEKITEDYRERLQGKPLLVIGMLKGSFILCRILCGILISTVKLTL